MRPTSGRRAGQRSVADLARFDHDEGHRYELVGGDLIVEVSSPSTRRFDVVVKRGVYERRGVPEFWFVDLDADRVEADRLAGGEYGPPTLVGADETLRPTQFEGLEVEVDDVLRPLR